MKNTTTVKIPASVTHDHAYAYGYLTSSLLLIETLAANTRTESDLPYLLHLIKQEAQKARELDEDMSRRADERIKKFLAV